MREDKIYKIIFAETPQSPNNNKPKKNNIKEIKKILPKNIYILYMKFLLYVFFYISLL